MMCFFLVGVPHRLGMSIVSGGHHVCDIDLDHPSRIGHLSPIHIPRSICSPAATADLAGCGCDSSKEI
jgi:hypothetical protein